MTTEIAGYSCTTLQGFLGRHHPDIYVLSGGPDRGYNGICTIEVSTHLTRRRLVHRASSGNSDLLRKASDLQRSKRAMRETSLDVDYIAVIPICRRDAIG
jgi:hypothetical protein